MLFWGNYTRGAVSHKKTSRLCPWLSRQWAYSQYPGRYRASYSQQVHIDLRPSPPFVTTPCRFPAHNRPMISLEILSSKRKSFAGVDNLHAGQFQNVVSWCSEGESQCSQVGRLLLFQWANRRDLMELPYATAHAHFYCAHFALLSTESAGATPRTDWLRLLKQRTLVNELN